jgi:hypothetical protein
VFVSCSHDRREGKVVPVFNKHMSGSGGITSPFLTQALDGGVWSASLPDRLSPGETGRGTRWLGSDPVLICGDERILGSARNRTPASQHVASRYTDRVIPSLHSNIPRCVKLV